MHKRDSQSALAFICCREQSSVRLQTSPLDESFETAVGHPFHIERHLIWHWQRFHLGHDLLVDRVAVRLVLENNEGEEGCLGGFQSGQGFEVAAFRHSGKVITHAFEVLQRPVFHPRFLAHRCHLLICRDFALRYWYYESVNVGHRSVSFVVNPSTCRSNG